jgi:hypothetical protein
MAKALISLLDITKRKGGDQEIGLLEDTIIYAPELGAIMGRPIVGTQYKTVHRSLPTVAFRIANNGSATVKGMYRDSLHECSIIDAQLQVDTAVVDAAAPGDGPQSDIGDPLFDEASGVIQGVYITAGAQLYYGTANDVNGFGGIAPFVGTSNAAANTTPVCVKAGGSSANAQTSVYFIWENIRGAHFIFGKNRGITMMPEWRTQQVNGANSLPLTALVNNIQGWLGFAINHPLSVARLCNINGPTDGYPVTDRLIAAVLSWLPLQMQAEAMANLNTGGPNKFGPGLKILMNPQAFYGLQNSRTPIMLNAGTAATVGTAITSDKPLQYPRMDLQSNGIPIVLTNSITNTEAVVA